MDDNRTSKEARTYSNKMGGWYRVVRAIVGLLLKLLTRVTVEGLENIPAKGPYLLVTNHLHWLDSPVIMATFPYRAHVFVAEKWQDHPFLNPLFRSLDAIFVQRGEVDRQALRKALGVLEGGGILGLAPEGTRSKTGSMQRGRSGAAYMALRTGVDVVPVATYGQETFSSALRRLRRPRIHVTYGPPFSPPAVEGKASPSEVRAFAEEIMYRLAAMLPSSYRGVYSDVPDTRPDLLTFYAAGHQNPTKQGAVE